MNSHDTVVDLPAIAIPLSTGADRFLAALGRARFVHATDGFQMSMLLDDDLLAPIS